MNTFSYSRILSGMQPTGALHVGNYLGALKNWVSLQNAHECWFCIVDLHAITVPQDPTILRAALRETAAAYLAAGIDPQRATLFVQSAVPAHSELSWILSTMTPLGWLNRMTQYKDKASKSRDSEALGLYAYPVLMASDILAYKATHVPVGEDQKQHLELARDLAGAFNRLAEREVFPLPEPQILGEATRVMSLRDGTKKMSKSDESDYSRLNLTDDADTLARKIRKAKTDSEPLPQTLEELAHRPEAENLLTITAALMDVDRKVLLTQYAGSPFSRLKADLIDVAVACLAPISVRMRHLLEDTQAIDDLLDSGAERARELTNQTLREVWNVLGLRGR